MSEKKVGMGPTDRAVKCLTIKQAAAEHQCNEKTIRRYIAQKKIPSTQAGKGKLIRIPLEGWHKFIEGKR